MVMFGHNLNTVHSKKHVRHLWSKSGGGGGWVPAHLKAGLISFDIMGLLCMLHAVPCLLLTTTPHLLLKKKAVPLSGLHLHSGCILTLGVPWEMGMCLQQGSCEILPGTFRRRVGERMGRERRGKKRKGMKRGDTEKERGLPFRWRNGKAGAQQLPQPSTESWFEKRSQGGPWVQGSWGPAGAITFGHRIWGHRSRDTLPVAQAGCLSLAI